MDRLELILGSWVVGSGIFVFYHVYPFIKKTIEVAKSGVNTDVSFFYGKYSELLFFVALAIIGVGTWLYYSSRRWQLASRQKLANFLYPLTAIILFYPLYNTATRGAMIGLLGGLLLSALIIIIWGKETPKLRKTAILIAFFLVVVSGALWLARDTNVIRENATLSRLTSINWNDADANARKMVWNMAWQGVKERPILGWGQEGFNYVFNKYYDPGMYLREQWFDRTHNIIFDWLIAGGILGLLSYLSLLIFAALYIADWAPKFIKSKMSEPAHRFTTLEKALFVGFLAAYFFQVFFVFDNVVSYIVLFAFLAYLHSRSAVQIEAIEKAESVTDADAARFYAPIMLVLLAASIWFVNGRSITASRDLIRALNRQPEPMANYDYFKKAIADGGFANQEIREQIVQAAANVAAVSDQQVSPTIKSAFVALAQSELEKQIEESPKDARIHVFAGSFYSIINNVQAAISELEKALTLSPNKQVIKATLANIYLREGTVNHNAEYVKKSATLMKSAFESAPQFTDVRNGYIVASIYAGDLKSANSVIDKYQDDAPIDQHVTQALVDAGQSERALAVAKNSYSKFPNDPNAAVTLASVYVQLGAKTTAISILKEAAGKIPSYKDKLTELATQIQNSK
jgi:O-antigen ligase/predicted Zn-dependent protease